MQIRCRTKFDITHTGVTGHYRSSRVPFKDHAGQPVVDEPTWNVSRNQQRNWETLQQLISLRTNISSVEDSVRDCEFWTFEFSTDNEVFGDDLTTLKNDCDHVPMLTDLTETAELPAYLQPDVNIWFEVVPVNIS